MSLKFNIAANYLGQAYVVLIAVLMMPVYLRYLGTEAYGLIGFFTLMSAWLQVLDLGLSPTMARECARYRGGAVDGGTLRALLNTLQIGFLSMAALLAGGFALLAPTVATRWLRLESLPAGEVTSALMLMGAAVSCQWACGLYRGVLNGFERQVWLSSFNIFIATARFLGVLAVLTLLGASPVNFFAYELIVALVELAVIGAFSHRLTRKAHAGKAGLLGWPALAPVARFAGGIAFAALVWIIISQLDKLILSKVLPLSSFGIFTLAVGAAGLVSAVGAPIAQALTPRLTKLAARGARQEVTALYRDATQLACLMATPCVLTLILFAEPVLLIWTGNAQAAAAAAPILQLYALGNGLLTVTAFPYYLQHAQGRLWLHNIGNIAMLVVLTPAILWAATRYGAIGAGWVWAGLHLTYLLLWTPVLHRVFAPGVHARWLLQDIAAVVLPAALTGWLLSRAIPMPTGRLETAAVIVLIAAVMGLVAAAGSSALWRHGRALLHARWGATVR